ncbi:syntaxin-22 isoform X2 [Cryptomeria japonica]|uniref:syntaxin-22 isoform X2 n=1 Tax=Cryptomeria japonica TaxID=3369 RepID=UPI0027DA24BE|nr:syntaxin-22 isoform X2 [Cryptomeria japonica]
MSFQDLQTSRPLPRRQGGSASAQQPSSSEAVAGGVFQINTAVSSFKRLVNDLGTPKDTPQLRDKLRTTRQHIGQLVKETSAKLKAASERDQNQEVPASKKIADAKLAKDFQAVLRDFQKAQQLAAECETTYPAVVPQPAESSENDFSAEVDQERQNLLQQQRRQEFFQLENEVVFNEAIIEERDQGIKEIHDQIVEVNEIFKDLAVLVNEQGVTIDDIGANIESSHAATVQAKSHLAKASKSQKSNRKCLSCWVPLVILGVVVVVVVIILLV